MNLILLMVLVLEVCLGICAWLSPVWLRSVAAHLLTRADVLDIVRKEEQRRMQFWSSELGLDGGSRPQIGQSLVSSGAMVSRQKAA